MWIRKVVGCRVLLVTMLSTALIASTDVAHASASTGSDLFMNPDGLPAARSTQAHVHKWDCVYHGYVLKPGGEAIRYDRATGTHWRRICNDVKGSGVLSPYVY